VKNSELLIDHFFGIFQKTIWQPTIFATLGDFFPANFILARVTKLFGRDQFMKRSFSILPNF
jgi:hypothetical protein